MITRENALKKQKPRTLPCVPGPRQAHGPVLLCGLDAHQLRANTEQRRQARPLTLRLLHHAAQGGYGRLRHLRIHAPWHAAAARLPGTEEPGRR